MRKNFSFAFSRLCNDSTVCRDLLRLGGIDRLVELCKNASERNYSDAVLVACLAVLRRVKHNLETKMRDDDNDFDDETRKTSATTRTSEDFRNLSLILDQLDATDLVQPKLVDSFVEYSSGKHSYVWIRRCRQFLVDSNNFDNFFERTAPKWIKNLTQVQRVKWTLISDGKQIKETFATTTLVNQGILTIFLCRQM